MSEGDIRNLEVKLISCHGGTWDSGPSKGPVNVQPITTHHPPTTSSDSKSKRVIISSARVLPTPPENSG